MIIVGLVVASRL